MNLKQLKIFSLIILASFLTSCGGGKYTYDFDQGKHVNFNSGKWILNTPKTNTANEMRIYEVAKNEFEEIIPDSSFFEIIDLRKDKLIGTELPHNPSREELRELKLFSDCDYLININNEVLKNDIGSFSSSRDYGKAKISNEARTEIKIYDLNTLELISNSTAIGKAETVESEDSGDLNYFDSGRTLAVKSLSKLIRKYKKYRKEED